MKKIILSLAVLLFTMNTSNAVNCLYNCVEPYDLSHGVSRFMSAVTGSNFLAEKVAKAILKREIAKNTQGKFSVKVDISEMLGSEQIAYFNIGANSCCARVNSDFCMKDCIRKGLY